MLCGLPVLQLQPVLLAVAIDPSLLMHPALVPPAPCSMAVRPRRPLARDPSLDYDYASSEDWEDEPEGEDLDDDALGKGEDDDASQITGGWRGWVGHVRCRGRVRVSQLHTP